MAECGPIVRDCDLLRKILRFLYKSGTFLTPLERVEKVFFVMRFQNFRRGEEERGRNSGAISRSSDEAVAGILKWS